MSILSTILVTLVAMLFFYIMYLETFATDSESTSRVLNIPQEELRKTSLNTLFKSRCLQWFIRSSFIIWYISI